MLILKFRYVSSNNYILNIMYIVLINIENSIKREKEIGIIKIRIIKVIIIFNGDNDFIKYNHINISNKIINK